MAVKSVNEIPTAKSKSPAEPRHPRSEREREHAEAGRAGREEAPACSPEARCDESADERTEAEGRRQETETLWADVERVRCEERDENVEVEADRADDGDDAEHGAELRVVPDEAECAAHPVDDPRGRVPLDRVQLLPPQARERSKDGEEAEGVDDEADPGAGHGDHDACDRRPITREPLKRPAFSATAFGSERGPTIW